MWVNTSLQEAFTRNTNGLTLIKEKEQVLTNTQHESKLLHKMKILIQAQCTINYWIKADDGGGFSYYSELPKILHVLPHIYVSSS